jgi:iron complex transport system substrate-binding protein
MKALKYKRTLSLLSVRFLVVATIAPCAIAACQTQTHNPETSKSNRTDCRTIKHEAGETQVCGQPERIVVLGPYVLEPLLALKVQPVAFADHDAFHQGDYDNPLKQIPYLGSLITQPIANVGLAYEPSVEAIVKVQPDLIIGIQTNAQQYDILSQIAPTILLKYAEPEDSLRAIAQAVNRTQQVEQILAETKQRIVAARETFAPLVASNPKMLLLYSGQLEEITLSHPSELCHSLPQKLGFQIVSSPKIDNSQPNIPVPISLETLPQFNEADSVILLGYDYQELKQVNNFSENQLSNIKQAWSENAIAQSLAASKAGRVNFIPAYLCLSLPGAIGTKLYLEELKQQLLPSQAS